MSDSTMSDSTTRCKCGHIKAWHTPKCGGRERNCLTVPCVCDGFEEAPADPGVAASAQLAAIRAHIEAPEGDLIEALDAWVAAAVEVEREKADAAWKATAEKCVSQADERCEDWTRKAREQAIRAEKAEKERDEARKELDETKTVNLQFSVAAARFAGPCIPLTPALRRRVERFVVASDDSKNSSERLGASWRLADVVAYLVDEAGEVAK
jgi:hypothetical protein